VLDGGRGDRLVLTGAAGALAGEQDEAVDEQEDGRRQRLGEDRAEDVLEREAGDAHRDRGDDDQPGQALVGVAGDEAPGAQRRTDGAQEAADDADPVLAEEHEQRDRGGAVQRDDVGQVERRLARGLRGLGDQRLPASAEPRRHEDRVPEARDREQLGDALDDGDDDGLQIRHRAGT
jgi:hypothetical protein